MESITSSDCCTTRWTVLVHSQRSRIRFDLPGLANKQDQLPCVLSIPAGTPSLCQWLGYIKACGLVHRNFILFCYCGWALGTAAEFWIVLFLFTKRPVGKQCVSYKKPLPVVCQSFLPREGQRLFEKKGRRLNSSRNTPTVHARSQQGASLSDEDSSWRHRKERRPAV